MKLYDYFQDTWLDKRYSGIMPSDDGYSDLLSSIIGKGKEFTNKCIEDIKYFIQFTKDDDFVENFGYIFNVHEIEYWEIRSEFDPLIKSTRKYNL
jgi:hypothetical protein